jgi:succinate dehydrogenase / fumarate reductase flavoprotein subunit
LEFRAGGGTANGAVLLDIASRRPASFIRRMLSHMYRQFLDLADVDITAQPMEVAPTCHYMMGGVRVSPESCASSVPGLFAAGEVAGGLHGANRLNGNGISELLVFGERAGRHAAAHAATRVRVPARDREQLEAAERRALAPLARAEGEDPYSLLRELQALMQRQAGLVRSEKGLQQALDAIGELAVRYQWTAARGGRASNPAWQCALDLGSLLIVAEAVVRSALARRESRGAHVRDDYPEADPALQSMNIVAGRKNGALRTWPEENLQARERDELMTGSSADLRTAS